MKRHKVTSKHTTAEAADLLDIRLSRGICTRVAKELKVSVSVVCRVAKGNSASRRIKDALLAEHARVKAEIRKRRRAA